MRIKWSEKAKRLAEKYELEDEIEVACLGFRTYKTIGTLNERGHMIWWYWKDKEIKCRVSLKPESPPI